MDFAGRYPDGEQFSGTIAGRDRAFCHYDLIQFLTLPVEIDASHRALAWLRNSGITDYQTQGYAFDALKWAAYTYVIAALSSLATLLYYIMIYLNRRD